MSVRVKGLPADEGALVSHLQDELEARNPHNRRRSRYYDSKHLVTQVGTTIPPIYANLATVLGWAGKAVDGLANRCVLQRMVWPDGDLDSLGMRELADANFLFSEFAQGRTDSLIHGVSFLVTTQGDVSAGEAPALVHAKSALDGTGDWNSRKRELDNFYSVTARNDQGEVTGFALYLDGETIQVAGDAGRLAVTNRVKHKWGVPVDPLVYRPRSSRRFGRSRINRPIMGLQDSALRAVVRLEAHMDIYTIPKLILLGADKSIFGDDSWRLLMGRALGLPDDEDAANPRADVKQFNAESPAPHLAQLNALAKMMARESDLPDADFALADMAVPTSGESYSASRENLIAEAERASDDWSPAYRKATARALAMQSGEDGIPEAWASIDTKWRSPMYLSRAAEADAGAKQVAAGPEWLRETRVGLELLGLSDQQIDLAQAERRLNQGRLIVEAVANGRLAVEGRAGDGDRGSGFGVAGGVSAVEVN